MLEQTHEIFNQGNNSTLIETAALRQKAINLDFSKDYIYNLFKSFQELFDWNEDNYLTQQLDELELGYFKSNGDLDQEILKKILLSNVGVKNFITTIGTSWISFYNKHQLKNNPRFIQIESENNESLDFFNILDHFIKPGIGINHLRSCKYLLADYTTENNPLIFNNVVHFNLEYAEFLIQLEKYWFKMKSDILNYTHNESISS